MIYALIATTILIIVVGLISTGDNILSPAVITAAVWLFCLLLYLFLPHGLPDLKGKFFAAILLWIILFSLSALCIQPIVIKRPTSNIEASKLIRDIYLIVSTVALIGFLFWVKSNLPDGFSGYWTGKLRAAALGKGENGTPYGGLHIIITYVALVLEMIYFKKKHWYRLFIIAFCSLGYAFFLMTKALFLIIFLILICILFFKKIIKIQHVAVGLFVLFFAFLAFQNIRSHNRNSKSDDFAVLYLVSSMYAFETLKPASSQNFGENSGRIFYAVKNKLGLSDTKPVDPMLKFVKKPISTNTYTILYPFYKDFGLWGVALFALFFGLLFGWIFANANAGNLFFVGIYAWLLNVLVIQYAAETLLTNLSGNIKFVIFLAIPFLVEKYKMLYKNERFY
jgi:oligosaccharide repeat unit polymerase